MVPIIQSFAQLEKNYGKEGSSIIIDNCQDILFGGFAPNSESAEILSKALEALERKRRMEEQKKAWTAEMVEGKLPEAIGRQALTLLLSPDKNGIEWKALSDAAAETRQTPLRLMLALGGIASPWRWHVDRLLYRRISRTGRGFLPGLPEPPADTWRSSPIADVDAFSIDDSTTTEVDDAASIEHLEAASPA